MIRRCHRLMGHVSIRRTCERRAISADQAQAPRCGGEEAVLFDGNALAEGKPYFSFGGIAFRLTTTRGLEL